MRITFFYLNMNYNTKNWKSKYFTSRNSLSWYFDEILQLSESVVTFLTLKHGNLRCFCTQKHFQWYPRSKNQALEPWIIKIQVKSDLKYLKNPKNSEQRKRVHLHLGFFNFFRLFFSKMITLLFLIPN